MGPRARITTDDGGGIDQAVASEQLLRPVKVANKLKAGPRVDRQSGEIVAKVDATIVVMIAAAVVAVAVGSTEVDETTAARHR